MDFCGLGIVVNSSTRYYIRESTKLSVGLCGMFFFFFNFLVLMDVRVRVIEHIQIERSVSCVNGGVESHMILWVSESCLSCGFLGPQLFQAEWKFYSRFVCGKITFRPFNLFLTANC